MTKERQKCLDDGLIDESFITKNSFSHNDISGYIYKITKKTTGRFNIKGITDYQFEVIEIVPITANILEREKYFIQKYYKENPEKSLNIMCTANINADQMEIENLVKGGCEG